MYCEKCRKQSPDNFQNCAYCGASLAPKKKKEPERFKKKFDFKFKLSMKTFLKISLAVAVVLTVCAVITAVFTSSKPEGVVKNLVKAIETNDKELYVSLYDEYLYEYKKDNRYFGEEETFNNISSPVNESREFYKEKCGDDFKLKYSVETSETLGEAEVLSFSEVLEHSFGYVAYPSKVEILSVEIIAKGEKGDYKSVYNDFWCMKIKGRWYVVDKSIISEFTKAS